METLLWICIYIAGFLVTNLVGVMVFRKKYHPRYTWVDDDDVMMIGVVSLIWPVSIVIALSAFVLWSVAYFPIRLFAWWIQSLSESFNDK